MPSPRSIRARWWLSILVVLAVGAVLRFARLSVYPPGFHYDEAANFIISREIAFEGARPFPVFEAFNGREVLYYYVNALAMRALGAHIFTVHLVGAWLNWLAIAATVALGRAALGGRVFGGRAPDGRRGLALGLVAGGVMAVSFPQVFIARQGFRAVTLPVLQALSLWALFAGLRRSRGGWGWLIAAGALGGAALYTYQASRLFPLWAGLVVLVVTLADRPNRARRLRQGAVVLGVLAVVGLPMGVYALDHPDIFADRLDQLSPGADTPSYAESARRHALMFFIEGDPVRRYNDPLAPYFGPVTGGLLVIGLGVSLWRAFRAGDPVARAAYALTACSPLMVLPAVLAVAGFPPSHMRSIGMVPAVFLLPALGALALWEALRGRWPRLAESSLVPVAGGAALIALAATTWGHYTDWATHPDLFYLADGDMVTAGAWLAEHRAKSDLLYVTSVHYDHPSLLVHDLPGAAITYLTGERLFLPPPETAAYLVETEGAPLPDALRPLPDGFRRVAVLPGPDGRIACTVYRWAPVAAPGPDPQPGPVGGWLALAGADLPPAVAGEPVEVLSRWRILAPPGADDLTPLVHLESPEGDVLARAEPFTQGSTRWRPGETLLQLARLEVPPGTPPGEYPVRVAWVARTADRYIGRLDEAGHFAGLWLDLGMLTVDAPPVFPPPWEIGIPHRTRHDLAAGVRLLGWGKLPETIRPGESPDLDLYWQALADGPEAGPVRVLAVPEDGTAVELWAGAPDMGRYPFSAWRSGEIVIDRHRWRLPPGLPPGPVTLRVTLGAGAVDIGTITVLELDRQFDPPETDHPLVLIFGETVRLAGYDLAVEGDAVALTLHWQALAPTELPLTVFVHLVGPDGATVDQHDAQPRANSYPVALWLPDEYVSDPVTLAFPPGAPPGTYTLRVGLYLQASGLRLGITGPGGESLGDAWPLAAIARE